MPERYRVLTINGKRYMVGGANDYERDQSWLSKYGPLVGAGLCLASSFVMIALILHGIV